MQTFISDARHRFNQGIYLITTRCRDASPIKVEARPTRCFLQGIQRKLEVPEINKNANANWRKGWRQDCLAMLEKNKGAFRAPLFIMLISQLRNRGD